MAPLAMRAEIGPQNTTIYLQWVYKIAESHVYIINNTFSLNTENNSWFSFTIRNLELTEKKKYLQSPIRGTYIRFISSKVLKKSLPHTHMQQKHTNTLSNKHTQI